MLRFAASPTGDMLISDLRIALFNYILSRQQEEDLIVRIVDIHKEKNIQDKDKEILDLLSFFGIEYSQVIYQSEKVRFHTAMALQLMHDKKAFSCFCSDEWLGKKREEAKLSKQKYRYDDACATLPDELVIDNINPFTIRIKKPANSLASDDIDSFIIMNKDKIPTYDFACAVDDMLSDISMVIYEQNSIYDTRKEEYIRTSLHYDKKIQHIYVPTLLDSPSVKSLLEEGFLPEAISNYLISIGNESPCDIFTLKEAIAWFDLNSLSTTTFLFNIDALKEINKQHLLRLDAKELSRYVGFADEEIGLLARVYLKEVYTTKELKNKIALIFGQRDILNEFKKQSKLMILAIKSAPYFIEYDDFKKHVMQESGINDENLLCYILTGSQNEPDIAQVYRYIKNYIAEIVK